MTAAAITPQSNQLLRALSAEVQAHLVPMLERVEVPLDKVVYEPKLGVIEYRRGEIIVLDRTRLEVQSCECYAVVKKESDGLLPQAGEQR